MSSISPAYYDPYNNVSYLELNKSRYGEIERHESEKLENRTRRPSVRKIYLKKNGDSKKNKPKKFIWKKWASPTLKLLIDDAGTFMGMGSEAKFLYDKSGYRIRDEDEIHEGETYYVAGSETFEIFDGDFDTGVTPRNNYSRQSYQYNKVPKNGYIPAPRKDPGRRESRVSQANNRRGSWWSTTSEDLIDYDYDKYDYRSPSPRRYRSKSATSFYDPGHHYSSVPRPISTSHRSAYPISADAHGRDSVYRHYDYGEIPSPRRETRREYPKSGDPRSAPAVKTPKREKSRRRASILDTRDTYRDVPTRHTYPLHDEPRGRSRARTSQSAAHINLTSDFDHDDALRKDKVEMKKHKEMMKSYNRSKSGVIYNRRDQTHPDAYLIYVFLNGQGMNCQHINFQKKQLEKGMHYVLELVARRYNVNPAKLCNMDGKKINEVQDLMSRGAYVLVPVGQKFRDQWYFLPDNAIDTSSNVDRIRERSAQRDRLLQRREKKAKSVAGRKKYDVTRSKSMDLTRGPSRKSLY